MKYEQLQASVGAGVAAEARVPARLFPVQFALQLYLDAHEVSEGVSPVAAAHAEFV